MTDQAKILVIDDNRSIHEDIRTILSGPSDASEDLATLEAELFGEDAPVVAGPGYHIDSALQGKEGFEMVAESLQTRTPYSMAFVDMRMPPGWDGLETVQRIWEVDPLLEVVICTAYSDYSWSEIAEAVGDTDQLLILKKPFDMIEVQQVAKALVTKWNTQKKLGRQMEELEDRVKERTSELEKLTQNLRKEIEDRERIEVELRHAQKLEAVGRLASGVAKEINTPIQSVGDSVQFLSTSFEDLTTLVSTYRELMGDNGTPPDWTTIRPKLDEATEDADLEYLQEEVPKAFERTMEGIGRVSGIVKAMKDFAHSDHDERQEADINRAISSTLMVAGNEYKYVADIETAFGDIPPVPCNLGDINQVLLNLVVNAAHAIGDVAEGTDQKGVIRVRTWQEDKEVVVSIQDTGSGIPERVRGRIFDPFFTTKEAGRGTGQGLAVAHAIVVDRHGGSLDFETESGTGTTFFVRLPLEG